MFLVFQQTEFSLEKTSEDMIVHEHTIHQRRLPTRTHQTFEVIFQKIVLKADS